MSRPPGPGNRRPSACARTVRNTGIPPRSSRPRRAATPTAWSKPVVAARCRQNRAAAAEIRSLRGEKERAAPPPQPPCAEMPTDLRIKIRLLAECLKLVALVPAFWPAQVDVNRRYLGVSGSKEIAGDTENADRDADRNLHRITVQDVFDRDIDPDQPAKAAKNPGGRYGIEIGIGQLDRFRKH